MTWGGGCCVAGWQDNGRRVKHLSSSPRQLPLKRFCFISFAFYFFYGDIKLVLIVKYGIHINVVLVKVSECQEGKTDSGLHFGTCW